MRRLALFLLLLCAAPAHAEPRDGFRFPLAGPPVVDRGFQPPEVRWGSGHRGVDLRAERGERVLAAGPGRVSYAGTLAGRGVVTVTHSGGLRTTYEPVSTSVRPGQLVAAGDVLGQLAAGHASCRPGTTCLHWGLLRGDAYLDPLSLVAPQEVRLLPVEPAGAPEPGSGSRRAGTAVSAGSLALGVGLLATRRRPTPPLPPPIDLRQERARRRVA